MGMKKWIPDQVYKDEEQAENILQFLMAQYNSHKPPSEVPWVFGIYLKETAELIGHVGLSPCQGKAEIGYAIEEAQQGNGYATEAVRAMSLWGMNIFQLRPIFGIVASENAGSIRVLEKAGFVFQAETERTLHGKRRLVQTYIFN